MLILIRSGLQIPKKHLTPEVERALRTRLCKPNPAYESSQRYGRYTGNMERLLYFYEDQPDHLRIPRGALGLVRETLAKFGISPDFDSAVHTNTMRPVPVEDFAVELRPYQRDCVDAMHKRVQGVVQMPCGSGKTTTGAIALLSTGEPGLVLVHTEDIQQQWVQTITQLTAGDRPRIIQGKGSSLKPLRPGEIAVAMVQTLAGARQSRQLLQSVGALITDEAHHVPANQWRPIVDRCPARYRWGLTATPDRSDGLGFMLHFLMGPTIFQMGTNELIRQGYLFRPYIIPVDSGWEPGDDLYPANVPCYSCGTKIQVVPARHEREGTTCPKCDNYLSSQSDTERGRINYSKAVTVSSKDKDRMSLISDLTEAAVADGRTVLILVPRKKAVWSLVRDLESRGITAIGITSQDGKEIRSRKLRDARAGRVEAVVATQLADEGLDLPILDCAINTSAGRSKGRARQRVGRTLRPVGKTPVVFELVDGGEFRSQWDSRKRVYIQEYGPCVHGSEPLGLTEALAALQAINAKSQKLSGVGF